jgi:hypothetical protein
MAGEAWESEILRFIGTSFLSLLVTVCSPKPQTLPLTMLLSDIQQDFLF